MSKIPAILFICVLSLPAGWAQDHASAAAHHRQGMALYRAHDPKGAIVELTKAVEIDTRYAEAWNDLGVIQRQQGHLKTAVDCFRKAIAANPQFSGTLYNLALALEASGDFGAATQQVRQFLALAP